MKGINKPCMKSDMVLSNGTYMSPILLVANHFSKKSFLFFTVKDGFEDLDDEDETAGEHEERDSEQQDSDEEVA